jgi:ketosteroid isomerase-like protein
MCHKQGMTPGRIRKLIICLLCFAPLLSGQQEGPDASSVLSLERKWTEAYKHREIAILSSLLSEQFVITVEDGSTYGKEGYISHTADSSVHVQAAELSDLKVRSHANIAVVTGAYYERGDSKGKAYEYRDRLTDVWMKSNGKWQVVASHYSVPVKP